jgi:hypothetical protein
MILSMFFASAFAQQIPVGSCGIVNIYDAAGNRTRRTYFCNNGTNPYPQRPGASPTQNIIDSTTATDEFQEVDALYPNPTSGKFTITFSNVLDNATIHLLDANGKAIKQVKAGGNRIEFDLSAQASGVYYIRIKQDGKTITKKVVKQ